MHLLNNMRLAHRITITAFEKPEETSINESIQKLIPFNLEEQKIKLEIQKAKGFNEKIIKIYTITLLKESHIKEFLTEFIQRLTQEQKETILSQTETRLDEHYDFFIRIDKEAWKEDKIWLTDTGNCYHIRISLAVYPKNKQKAIESIKKIIEL